MKIEYMKRLWEHLTGKILYLTSFLSAIIMIIPNELNEKIAILGDIVQSYLGIKLDTIYATFSWKYTTIMLFLLLIISSYQVWKEVKDELNKLNENPVDYDIIATIRKVFIDIEDIKKYVDDNVTKINGLIEEADRIILQKKEEINNLKSGSVSITKGIRITATDYMKIYLEHINELDIYKKELNNYHNQAEIYLTKWEEFINSDLTNIYYVKFEIKNTGNKSDKNINVKVELSNNNKHIENIKKLNNYPKLQPLPNNPMTSNNINNEIPTITNHLDRMEDLMQDIQYPTDMHKNEEINEHNFSINIKNLNAGNKDKLFKKESFFINIEKQENIKTIINSENLKSIIEKNVKFINEKEINYIDIEE